MHRIHKKATFTFFVTILSLLIIVSPLQAQETNTKTAFTATDTFNIPELDSNINFAFNGTYNEVEFENNTWFFKGLELNNTQALANYGFTDITGLKDLAISAENSNVTILAFLSFNYSWTSQVLIYSVEGYGTQTIDLGINASQPTGVDEWSVLVDDGATFLAEGSGWQLQDDNTIVVSAGVGNITVMHFDFGDSTMANLSFMMQHYMIVLTIVLLAVVVVVATFVKVKKRKRNQST